MVCAVWNKFDWTGKSETFNTNGNVCCQRNLFQSVPVVFAVKYYKVDGVVDIFLLFFLLFIILFCTVLIGWNTLYQLQVCVSSLTSNIDQVKFMVIMTCEEHQSMMKNYETARTFKWIYAARKEFFRFLFLFLEEWERKSEQNFAFRISD